MYMETGFRHIQFLIFNQLYFFNFETFTRTLDTDTSLCYPQKWSYLVSNSTEK